MNVKFVVNDYMLIWNLFFQASISEPVHKIKQKLWMNYKRQYSKIEKDNLYLLQDTKDFIPDDDTLYNLFIETNVYDQIKKQTEQYRLSILKIWDNYKKEVSIILKELLRFDLKPYKVLLVHPALNVVDYVKSKEKKYHAITFGKGGVHYDEYQLLTDLVYGIVKNEMGTYLEEYKEIVQAVIELAIQNEFHTRISKTSHYLSGDPTLKFLKRQIYPYWLMYLGADREEMLRYMMRDKIAFDVEKYALETELSKVDLYSFIDFCIKNQKYIVKISDLEII